MTANLILTAAPFATIIVAILRAEKWHLAKWIRSEWRFNRSIA